MCSLSSSSWHYIFTKYIKAYKTSIVMNAFFTPLNTYFSQQGEYIFIYHNFMNRSTYFPFPKTIQ